MSKTRVPKGEKYYLINTTLGTLEVDYLRDWRTGEDDAFFKTGNYFHTEEEAEVCARKLRAVLKGADVIEMPSEGEAMNDCNKRTKHLKKINPHCYLFMNGNTLSAYEDGWRDCFNNLESKIAK